MHSSSSSEEPSTDLVREVLQLPTRFPLAVKRTPEGRKMVYTSLARVTVAPVSRSRATMSTVVGPTLSKCTARRPSGEKAARAETAPTAMPGVASTCSPPFAVSKTTRVSRQLGPRLRNRTRRPPGGKATDWGSWVQGVGNAMLLPSPWTWPASFFQSQRSSSTLKTTA
jgi:hypothetical protein